MKKQGFERNSHYFKLQENISNMVKLIGVHLTFLPALLLCLFMTARGLLPLALASVNCSENQPPNLMLLLQPAHVQPLWVTPLRERSQSQLSMFPELHEVVTACATPAAVTACRYADSRLAGEAISININLNCMK